MENREEVCDEFRNPCPEKSNQIQKDGEIIGQEIGDECRADRSEIWLGFVRSEKDELVRWFGS